MKVFVSTIALSLALGMAVPAFAADKDNMMKMTNKADCEKGGGMWDTDSQKCKGKM